MAEAAPTLWQRLWYTRLRDAMRGRLDASLDWRLVVANADLPTELADAVGKVVQRTRLWRAEKVDVAIELVAHFQDGLAAGRSSQQLVAAFGDPQQAAQLIRRAKKRGRPLTWHVWRCSWWAFVAVIVLYALLAAYFLMGRTSPSINYLSRLNRDVLRVEEDNRAWPLYRGALLGLEELVQKDNYRVVSDEFKAIAEARPGEARWPDTRRYLEEHADAMAQLRTATRRPHLGYSVGHTIAAADQPLLGEHGAGPMEPGAAHRPLYSVVIPHIQALRSGSALLLADVYRAVEIRDAQLAHADVVALLDMSRQVGETPFLVSGLVAMQMEQQACEAIEPVLTANPDLWSREQLTELAHRVSSFQPNVIGWLESERIQMRDSIQRIYSDDGHGDGQITLAGLLWMNTFRFGKVDPDEAIKKRLIFGAGIPIAATIIASRAEVERKIDELFAMAVADYQRPLWDDRKQSAYQELRRLERSDWLRIKYAPIVVMMPAIKAVDTAVIRSNARADGVVIGIALELYRRENGAWPASLNDLSPRYLPTVPVDPINSGPLGFRIVDDRPIVYSLGVDRDDDGGRLPMGDGDHPDAYYAGPTFWRHEPVRDVQLDGDWVIWSTVESR